MLPPVYAEKCSFCHGDLGEGLGGFPKLQGYTKTLDRMTAIIRNGDSPMPAYNASVVSDADITAIYNYFKMTPTSSSQPSSVAISSKSASSVSSSAPFDRNHYDAPRAVIAPIIDGVAEAVWDTAAWAPINVFWLGQNPSAQDFSGRYKAMWDAGNLYFLFDITDDTLLDATSNPLERYWDDDSVEIFLDENKNGGDHQFNTKAWAYHISTLGDSVDITNSGNAKLLNSHITVKRVSVGTKHLWEMSVRVYGENYDDNKANTPVPLLAGKQMGFSACYNDNDASSNRESMVGSVDTQGHKDNQGYINASVFGSMTLVETLAFSR